MYEIRPRSGRLTYGIFHDYADIKRGVCTKIILAQRDGERIAEFEKRVAEYKMSRKDGAK